LLCLLRIERETRSAVLCVVWIFIGRLISSSVVVIAVAWVHDVVWWHTIVWVDSVVDGVVIRLCMVVQLDIVRLDAARLDVAVLLGVVRLDIVRLDVAVWLDIVRLDVAVWLNVGAWLDVVGQRIVH